MMPGALSGAGIAPPRALPARMILPVRALRPS